MTPSALNRKLRSLASTLDRLARNVDHVANELADGGSCLAALRSLQSCARDVHRLREQFADAKAGLASRAKDNEGETHLSIAEAIDVSKPYVQQMVYRGREI